MEAVETASRSKLEEKMAPKKKVLVRSKASKPKAAPKKSKAVRKAKPSKPLKAFKPKILLFQPEIRIYSTPETLVQESAHQVMQIAREAVNERGRFVAALSGGTTPKGLFQQLTEEPYRTLIPWAKTYLFWVDERHVPLEHETSNYRMAQEFLLSKAPVPKENVFPATNGSLPVDKAARAYEMKMKKFFGEGSQPRFDLCLMGMGDDGHTASLFPGVPQVNELDKWVVGYFVDEARKERVSLTFPVLNAARFLMVLVEGEKKAAMVKDALGGPSEPPRYPIQYLRPAQGKLVFEMDQAAAALLKK
jgi:6-phosphogluconolactonase